MRFRSSARIGLAGVIALGALGCAGMADQQTMFHESYRRYTQLMRYTDFDRARIFVAADARPEFRARTNALGDIHFTDYEIESIEDGPKSGTVRVEYTGYRMSSPTIVTYSEEQHWELAGNTWTVRPKLEENTP